MSSTKAPQRLTRFDEFRERRSRNQRIAAVVVGIGLALALVMVAVVISSDGGSQPGDTTSTPPTPPAPTVVNGRTHQFEVPFTYTVPSSWTYSGEGDVYLSMDMPAAPGGDFLVLSSVVAARSDCSVRPEEGVGTSSDAIMEWLSTHPALDATTPQPITLGGATGSWVDVRLAADWHKNCPKGLGLLTGHPDGPQSDSIYGDERMRLYVLDLPAGNNVAIMVDTPIASEFQDVIDEAAPVVESFDFRT